MEAWRMELYHHGILGMKWGVRRYQNADGTLTEAGKKRYGGDMYTRTTRAAIERENNGGIQEFNRKYGHLAESNPDKYDKLHDEYFNGLWNEEWKKTEAAYNTPRKSVRELNRLVNGRAGNARLLDQYRDKDGNLTDEGRKRMKQYTEINAFSKAKSQYENLENTAKKEAREKKFNAAKTKIDAANNIVSGSKKALEAYDKIAERKKKNTPVDLSSMSDKELQQRINRMNMERQYLSMTNPKTVSKGRQAVEDTLSVAGSVLAVASSAVTIAVAIQTLKGGE